MTLPDLALQIVYGKATWALVLVTVLLALATRLAPGFAQRHWRAAATAMVVLAALPADWSPAWWLTLAFQYPSGLLAGYALVSLAALRQGRTPRFVLPLPVALPLALLGVILYLDTFGVLSLGLYYGGFGAVGAPLLGCAAIAGCAFAILRGHAVQPAVALATGLLLYALLRLPTGNLWDALLDPLLWTWALASALVAGVRRVAGARVPGVEPVFGHDPAPAPVSVPVPAPVLANGLAAPQAPAAGIEQLQP